MTYRNIEMNQLPGLFNLFSFVQRSTELFEICLDLIWQNKGIRRQMKWMFIVSANEWFDKIYRVLILSKLMSRPYLDIIETWN